MPRSTTRRRELGSGARGGGGHRDWAHRDNAALHEAQFAVVVGSALKARRVARRLRSAAGAESLPAAGLWQRGLVDEALCGCLVQPGGSA